MIGRILSNKYRILGHIGTGGMAKVFRAAQITPPHRTVAIKVLKEEYQEDISFLRRFQTEAQAVLGLSHENIVRSYDVGRDQNVHYIVLEYVEGHTLKDRIRDSGDGFLSARDAVQIGLQILDALHHAHDKGIIHRDIKPQNIIVGAKGRAKLTDFGIARITDTDNTMTYAGGSVLGSAHYLSPEQAKGLPVTAASDIYSMGATLYEMVTGSVPFKGESSVAIALRHLQDELIPPHIVNPSVPRALSDVIVKAMQKDPERRYRSARDMRRDLARVLKDPDGDYVKILPAETDPLPAPVRRRSVRRVLRIALPVLMLMLLIGAVFFGVQAVISMIRGNEAHLVPNLLGKTVEEAVQLAGLRDYTVEVIDTLPSQEYESGLVMVQKPNAGTELTPGGILSITVSSGMGDSTYVPDLLGRTLNEAQALLSEVGLELGSVEYRESENAPGLIFLQNPVSGTEVLALESVDVLISSLPAGQFEVPDVLYQSLGDALRSMTERGFSHFLIRGAEPRDDGAAVVTALDPEPGEIISAEHLLELSLSPLADAPVFTATLALSIPVAQAETSFMIVVERLFGEIPYTFVLYESVLREGQNNLEALLTLDEGGLFDAILLVGGEEWQRMPVNLTEQSATTEMEADDE